MTNKEVMQMALDWIEAQPEPRMIGAWERIKALRTALAQPEPEPNKLINVNSVLEQAGYVKKKEWVGLTDDEIKNSMQGHNTQMDFARAIEAKLKEKNHG